MSCLRFKPLSEHSSTSACILIPASIIWHIGYMEMNCVEHGFIVKGIFNVVQIHVILRSDNCLDLLTLPHSLTMFIAHASQLCSWLVISPRQLHTMENGT